MGTEIENDNKPVDTAFRFKFGRNWRNYITNIAEDRVGLAEDSLKGLLDCDSLSGKTFVDVGCGSGIFSLAAIRLGAKKVVSIDYDQDSVDCAKYLNNKFGPFENWEILQGSILNKDFIQSLGKHDIVYSWGVLHHTGNMWTALDNASLLSGNSGSLVISIYNDQGLLSTFWTYVKYLYNKSPRLLQVILGNLFFVVWAVLMLVLDIVNRRPVGDRYRGVNARGMNAYYDAIDWIGGYPFEVAKPEDLVNFYKERGFNLVKLNRRPGMGCNELVFSKTGS